MAMRLRWIAVIVALLFCCVHECHASVVRPQITMIIGWQEYIYDYQVAQNNNIYIKDKENRIYVYDTNGREIDNFKISAGDIWRFATDFEDTYYFVWGSVYAVCKYNRKNTTISLRTPFSNTYRYVNKMQIINSTYLYVFLLPWVFQIFY